MGAKKFTLPKELKSFKVNIQRNSYNQSFASLSLAFSVLSLFCLLGSALRCA